MKQIIMPKLGLTMEEGTLIRWHKREGEIVSKGEPLFEVETEKSTNEIVAADSGVLGKILLTEGESGNAAQHMQSLEAWFVHVPGLRVVMPSTPADAKGLLKTAIHSDDPVIFVENKLLYRTRGEVPAGEYLIPFGKADIKRPGSHVTLVGTSRMMLFCLSAAEIVASEGIDVEVIDPRTLAPLDMDTIFASVHKTGHVVVVHEACQTCGIGSEIVAQIQEYAFDSLDGPALRVANPSVPIPFSPSLEADSIPSEVRIIAAVKRSLGIQ